MNKYKISVGKSRRDTNWGVSEVTWDQLTTKLRTPHRTVETMLDYSKMSKEEKGNAKDVGGFVGGVVNNGRRKKENILSRSLITLDLDFAGENTWIDVSMWGWTCCMYSTHSHTKKNPRYRIIIPMDREVSTEEYEPIARKIAECIGMEQLDKTSFACDRLMYWPSCSSDAEYVFKEQGGEILCADEILAEYGLEDAWKDARLWPTAKEEATVVVREVKTQGDPREKPGIVGLFCRAYDILSAVDEFIPGTYIPEENGRLTYTLGSTSSGAVLYNDGTFLYSHHNTDPCGGQLVNAFDLVRIHLFGDLDDKAAEGTPINRMPSYTKMSELAGNDATVKRLMSEERMREAQEHFADLLYISDCETETDADISAEPTPAEEDPEWTNKLKVNHKTGEADPIIENAILILNNDPMLKGKLRFNAFRQEPVAYGGLPWRRLKPGKKERTWTDSDDANLRRYMETVWHFSAVNKLNDAVTVVTHEQEYDPLQNYLKGLHWDGTERLDTVLIRYFGAEYTPYTRAITRKWFVAGCKRAFEPGCKFDSLLVLVGEQGAGKSQFGQLVSKGWFTDSIQRIDNKDAYDQLQGVWIVEMSEFSATKKADNEAIKAFFSKTEDRYRRAYEHRTEDHPRHCIFLATTNDKSVIKDETGGRRFWIVPLHAKREDVVPRLNAFREEVDQLWAEAVVRYKDGEKIYEDTQELLDYATEMQSAYTQDDEMQGLLEEFLNTPLPDDWDTLDQGQRVDYFRGADLQRPKGVGSKLRDCVSVAEVRAEMLGEDVTRNAGPNNETSRHIGRLMNVMPDGRKERQRGPSMAFRRCGAEYEAPGI